MLKPDVEMNGETGRVFYQGKVYDLQKRFDGLALQRPDPKTVYPIDVFVGADLDDVTRWLQIHDTTIPPMVD
jgi:hypothetical protein